jgi:hypothetical protein
VSQADEAETLSAAEEARLLTALEAALRPGELDPAVNERLIELALEDPLAPPSEAELIESARLRDALEGHAAHADLATLGALRAAYQSGAHEAPDLESALERALPAAARPRRTNVVYAVFGAGSAVLAAAAALVLVLGGSGSKEAPVAASAPLASGAAQSVVVAEADEPGDLARPRSTASLFTPGEPFRTADTTARIDLIASTRGRDLRGNRYAAWGVR